MSKPWRLITLDDGKQWLTDGTTGIDPDCVPRLLEQRNELLTVLRQVVEWADDSNAGRLVRPFNAARKIIKKIETP
jgi:hypothetical protein